MTTRGGGASVNFHFFFVVACSTSTTVRPSYVQEVEMIQHKEQPTHLAEDFALASPLSRDRPTKECTDNASTEP